MGVLLMLVGLLGVTSGGIKLRSRVRSTIGRSPVAFVETVSGALSLAASGVGLASARPLAWTLVSVTLTLTFLSTWKHAQMVGRYVQRREKSEALRLKAYLHSHEGLPNQTSQQSES